MGFDSKIEWTESTWNPVTGCTKISKDEGCRPRPPVAGQSSGFRGCPVRELLDSYILEDSIATISWLATAKLRMIQ